MGEPPWPRYGPSPGDEIGGFLTPNPSSGYRTIAGIMLVAAIVLALVSMALPWWYEGGPDGMELYFYPGSNVVVVCGQNGCPANYSQGTTTDDALNLSATGSVDQAVLTSLGLTTVALLVATGACFHGAGGHARTRRHLWATVLLAIACGSVLLGTALAFTLVPPPWLASSVPIATVGSSSAPALSGWNTTEYHLDAGIGWVLAVASAAVTFGACAVLALSWRLPFTPPEVVLDRRRASGDELL
jgi:hypothetical protein